MATGTKDVHDYGSTVARVLAEHRRQAGISLRALGERSGVDFTQASRMLRGLKPMTVDEFAALCGAMGAHPVAILREAEQRLGVVRAPFQVVDSDVAEERKAAKDVPYSPESEYEQ